MSGASEASASRLELRTYLTKSSNEPYWSVKLYEYGDGLAEIGWCYVEKPTNHSPLSERIEKCCEIPKSPPNEKRRRRDINPINIERSVRRAKANVRRKVMASGADHLLTLTYRENELDEAKAWMDWGKFARKVRETLGEFTHIVVAERQQRGAIHFHAGVIGFQDVRLLRSLWRSVVGDGNIDVQAKSNAKGNQWRRNKLAAYLSKYIAKNFDPESFTGRHRYRCSLGIEIKITQIFFPRNKMVNHILDLFLKVAGSVSYVWEPPNGGRFGWACSW